MWIRESSAALGSGSDCEGLVWAPRSARRPADRHREDRFRKSLLIFVVVALGIVTLTIYTVMYAVLGSWLAASILGYVEGVTHDYLRHGTTTLFAALNIASGQVLTQCTRRHRHQEFLQFLRHIETAVPSDLEVHLIVDHYATHKHAKVRRWLAARPRFHVHYTPTYAS